MKLPVEKQLEIYDMLNARCTVTEDGIEGVLTWQQINEIYYALHKESINESIWKDAQGDDLPEIDREVVVLCQPHPLEGNNYKVSFAHRPDPVGYWGKSVLDGEYEHYTPQTYDKGGWNQPDVRYWLDLDLPIKEE